MQPGNSELLKKFYLWTFLISVLLGVGCYIYFATEKPVYKASGKFTYFYSSTNSTATASVPYVSDQISKSIAESISTKAFAEKLYSASKLNFDHRYSDDPKKLVKSAVIAGSNVIQIQIYHTNIDALTKLSQNVFKVLEQSPILASSQVKPQLEIIDPMHVYNKPDYPKPLEYSGVVFLGSFLISLMFLYIFSSNEST